MARTRRTGFLAHLHPPMIHERTVRPGTTLALGVVCLSCLAVLIATGVTLLLYYIPFEDVAYDRILHIITTLHYGKLVRNLHYLAANVFLIGAILHMARVFFTGSYRGRFLNWTYGLLLLALVLMNNYTGYLLAWDQTSYWAIKVGSNLVGYFPILGPPVKRFLLASEEVGRDTLLRSFALHAAVLPALWLTLTSLHLWRIRKDGGLAAPEEAERARIPSSPTLFRAELAVGLMTLSLLLALSLVFNAPLSGRADPLHPPNPAKAPWYFVGVQEMVSYSAVAGGVVAPTVIALFLFLSPVLDLSKKPGGRWFQREKLAMNIIFALVFLSQAAFIVIGQWFRAKNWALVPPW